MRDRSPLHLSQQYVFLPVKHLTIPRETGLRLTPQNLQSMDPPRPAWPCQLPTLHGTRPRAQRELVEPKAKSTLNLSMPVIKKDGWRVLSIWSPNVPSNAPFCFLHLPVAAASANLQPNPFNVDQGIVPGLLLKLATCW
ncbi:hypothetical protein FRC02_010897 [Tulasnella sp. 418]|nr:hypothetical protein FRC02_010897 [Tulasnella sp. 418]